MTRLVLHPNPNRRQVEELCRWGFTPQTHYFWCGTVMEYPVTPENLHEHIQTHHQPPLHTIYSILAQPNPATPQPQATLVGYAEVSYLQPVFSPHINIPELSLDSPKRPTAATHNPSNHKTSGNVPLPSNVIPLFGRRNQNPAVTGTTAYLPQTPSNTDTPPTQEKTSVATIQRVLVHPEKRGLGYGQELMRQLLKTIHVSPPSPAPPDTFPVAGNPGSLPKPSAHLTQLIVSENNPGAVKAYQNVGFRIIDTFPAPDRPWHKHVMTNEPSPPSRD